MSAPTEAAEVIDKLVGSMKKLLTFMTLGRLFLLAALIIISIAALSIFENRQKIYVTLTAGDKYTAIEDIPPLSDVTKMFIKNMVDRTPNIVAVQVTKMNFRKNERETAYIYSKRAELMSEYEIYLASKTTNQPLFATGDVDQNERLIRIMNQDFVCVDMPPNLVQIAPSAAKLATQVCSISVPPRYGQLVGYINIWFEKPPEANQMLNYKSIARMISDEIYDRDILGGKK